MESCFYWHGNLPENIKHYKYNYTWLYLKTEIITLQFKKYTKPHINW
jgi:hypothetical protein